MKKSLPLFSLRDDGTHPSFLDRFAAGMFLVVLGAGILLAAWLLFQDATKRSVIRDLSAATRQGDIYALKEKTDWKSVRGWLKHDLKARHLREDEGDAHIDQLVDYYVRPDNLPSLLYYYNSNAGMVDPAAFIRDVRFSGMTQLTVEIAAPPQFDRPWLNQLEPVRAVFELEGLNWKLKRINAPDYLIPDNAPLMVAR